MGSEIISGAAKILCGDLGKGNALYLGLKTYYFWEFWFSWYVEVLWVSFKDLCEYERLVARNWV